jgi:hypothetical protein
MEPENSSSFTDPIRDQSNLVCIFVRYFLMLIFRLRLGLSSGLFPTGVTTQIPLRFTSSECNMLLLKEMYEAVTRLESLPNYWLPLLWRVHVLRVLK